jgi:hypothetical protein
MCEQGNLLILCSCGPLGCLHRSVPTFLCTVLALDQNCIILIFVILQCRPPPPARRATRPSTRCSRLSLPLAVFGDTDVPRWRLCAADSVCISGTGWYCRLTPPSSLCRSNFQLHPGSRPPVDRRLTTLTCTVSMNLLHVLIVIIILCVTHCPHSQITITMMPTVESVVVPAPALPARALWVRMCTLVPCVRRPRPRATLTATWESELPPVTPASVAS